MTEYLSFKADLSNPDVAEAFEDFSYWSSMFGQLLFRHLPLAPSAIALDIGCGTGFPLLELADRLGPNSSVHGVDTWGHAVVRARRKAAIRGNANLRIVRSDAAQLPYDDDSIDLIVSNLGLNNFADPDRVMAECHRVCKPGGRLALTTNLVGHMKEFYRVYEQVLVDTGNAGLVDKLSQHEAHRATLDGLHDLFSDAGFEISSVHTETFSLRYADGSAFLHAYLSRLGFLDGWRDVLAGTGQERAVFEELEARLNLLAKRSDGGLVVTVPAAYIEGRKASQ